MTEIPILSNEKGKKILLMGNEAIVRGALESGVGFASTYPGILNQELITSLVVLSIVTTFVAPLIIKFIVTKKRLK